MVCGLWRLVLRGWLFPERGPVNIVQRPAPCHFRCKKPHGNLPPGGASSPLMGYWPNEAKYPIAHEINNRPRKVLRLRSPVVVYRELLINHPQRSPLFKFQGTALRF